MLLDETRKHVGRQERGVTGENEKIAAESLQRRAAGPHRIARPPRLLLDGDLDRLRKLRRELGRAIRGAHHEKG